jgi:hypothetical protein
MPDRALAIALNAVLTSVPRVVTATTRARSLFIPDRNYSLTKYLADADGRSKRILPSRQTAGTEFPEYAGK